MNNILYNCKKLLTNMSGYIKQILEHATSQGYRSNVLKPLMGMLILLLTATLVLFYFNILIAGYIVLTLSILFILAFGYCYFYCLYKNPDLLRSEKFNLEKTALEKISIGDSSTGRIKLQNTDYVVIEEKGINNQVGEK